MIAKLPYLKQWDVTPCKIELSTEFGEDGGPEITATWEGLVNFSEKVRRVQDADGQWVQLSGVIHVKGDILPGEIFEDGTATVAGYGAKRILSYTRPRNPDGSVNHTRIELI